MGGIKAIETMYNGYHFRSRLEARWAVFFDTLGIEYVYEKEGYDLGDAGWYLPDFWLPQVNMWAEVKPKPLNDSELDKCIALVESTGDPCLILVGGEPTNHPYWGICTYQLEPDHMYELTDEECKRMVEHQRGILPMDGNYAWNWYCLSNEHGYLQSEHRFYCSPGAPEDAYPCDTDEAVIAAKSARFEKR